MKNYKIRCDCRQRGDGVHRAIQAVVSLTCTTSPSHHEQTSPLTAPICLGSALCNTL